MQAQRDQDSLLLWRMRWNDWGFLLSVARGTLEHGDRRLALGIESRDRSRDHLLDAGLENGNISDRSIAPLGPGCMGIEEEVRLAL